MSKHDNNIITNAAPHTVKKFELIEAYVDEWARKILGFSESKGVIYIDCMSNSGEYYDEENNVIEGTSIRVAKRLNEIIVNYENKKAILIFNDLNKNRVEHLENKINELKLKNIDITYHSEDCNSFLQGLNSNGWKEYNTLLLYDPYNASINWEAIKPFLNRWGEVIINHMVSDTIRGASQAKKEEVKKRYEETYQKDIDTIIEMGKDKEQFDKVIKEIIDRKSDKQHYIASFPFFTRTNGLLYNLIFCSTNIAGLILYKKIAWKTFGDKSSPKNIRDDLNLPCLDFGPEFELNKITDEECYTVSDIAKYIYNKYKINKTVLLSDIYDDLDKHPIFPSEGYKREIKTELTKLNVKIMKSSISFP